MIPLHRRLKWFSRETPQAIAIRDCKGEIDFNHAYQLVLKLASILIAAGIKPGENFIVLSSNRRESLLCFFAASLTGTVCTPINTKLVSKEIQDIVMDSGARLMFTERQLMKALKLGDAVTETIGNICFDEMAEKPAAISEQVELENSIAEFETRPEHPLFQMYSSGTTGQPSGMTISQMAWSAQIEQFRRTQPYQPGDGVLVVTPLFHIAAAITAMSSLVTGASVVLPEKFISSAVLEDLKEQKIRGTMMVPTMISEIVKLARVQNIKSISGVKRICYGASPITEVLLREALDLFGAEFIQGYGLTETAGVATILSGADHLDALENHPERLCSAGRPVMGVDVRIVNPQDEIVLENQIGEIQIKGPNLFLGYFKNPEKTAASMTEDGWFKSGDAGYIDADGYVFIVDRIKEIIISGGENIYPQEVEKAIAENEAVAEVTVCGVPHEKWGETVGAAIILKRNVEFDEAEMRAFLGDRIAKFKTPSHYRIVKKFPCNATGKVVRHVLVDQFLNKAQ